MGGDAYGAMAIGSCRSGRGFKFAPVVGRVLADPDLDAGRTTGAPYGADRLRFAVSRFA